MINELIKSKEYIMNYLERKYIQKADADEIYSQLTLLILETKPQIDDFRIWLKKELKQQCKIYKKHKNKEKYEGDISLEQLQEQGFEFKNSTNPRELLEQREMEQIKEEKVKNLSSTQLKYYRLFQQGLSNKEVAEELDLTVVGVIKMRNKIENLLKIEE